MERWAKPAKADVFGSVADFGQSLFTTNLLPFEVTALLLMVAVIGVVLLAGDDEPARRRPKARNGREPIAKPQESLLPMNPSPFDVPLGITLDCPRSCSSSASSA